MGCTSDPTHRIFIATFELALSELHRGQCPEPLPTFEDSGAHLVVARIAILVHRLVGEMEPIQNDCVVLGPVRSNGEAPEQPPAHLLPEIVERERVFLLEVRFQRERCRPEQALQKYLKRFERGPIQLPSNRGECNSGNSTTASPANLSEQLACQHFTGGSDLCRIAEHTDGPDSHLDSFSGTIHELRPEQIEGFHRNRPCGVVGQE